MQQPVVVALDPITQDDVFSLLLSDLRDLSQHATAANIETINSQKS
jgi:hypothetical protein